MSTVLVTGGAGYVGSHVCKALAEAGHTPVVYDNLSRGHRDFVKWGPLVEADVTDATALEAALNGHQVEAVIHCAALAYVGESVERPMDYYETNVIGAVSLLEAMKAADVKPLVLSSSCAVYGAPAEVPITEDAPFKPVSPYGRTKVMVEEMAIECARAYGFRSVALRYFNAAGADPDGEVGERHDPETHLIPNVLKAAAGTLPSVPVFGTDFDTPDGTAVRDYVHVADLAAAHVKALDFARDTEGHAAFNLGAGRGVSVKDVIAAAEAVTGTSIAVAAQARRPGDPPGLVANAAKANEVLDWTPERSDLDTMIADAWAYMKAHN